MTCPSFRAFSRITLGLLACLMLPAVVLADDTAQIQPSVDNSRFQFAGQTNSDGVIVRSGPGEAYYATQKLDSGAKVTVVGIKFDWLKILPPDGSFCYVSKLYIERRGDGSVGRVTKPDIRVRAGSQLNPIKTTVLTTLNVGDDVTILGEQDEYYKIAPPTGAYLYVNKQFIDPIKALAVNPVAGGDSTPPEQSQTPELPSTQPAVVDNGAPQAPATQPVDAMGPTTNPSESALAALQTRFDALEADFNSATSLPLDKQPDQDLKGRYEAIRNDPAMPDTLKRTVDFRLAILNVRVEAQRRLVAVKQMEQEAATKSMVLTAENKELQARLAAETVTTYAAVGQLQASSLQGGAQTLYRLIDPATGRTVVYLQSNDIKTMDMIGKFVGVRGETVTDDRLSIKVIPFTDMTVVDPADLNTKVQAELIPPSLLGRGATASSGNQ